MLYVILVAVVTVMVYYIFIPHKSSFHDLLFKSLSSAGFLIMAVFIMKQGYDETYMWLMLAGLFLGAMGDVFLALPYCYPKKKDVFFLLGLTSFLLGHMVYAAALYHTDMVGSAVSLGIAVIGGILMILLLKKLGTDFEKMMFPSMLYAMVILFMECQALSWLLADMNAYSVILNIGSLLFVLSDLVLVFILFHDLDTPPMRRLNLTLYYAAQMSLIFTFLVR